MIQIGDLAINLDTKMVEINGARVHLTAKEYQLLVFLGLRKEMTLTKEVILNQLYGGSTSRKSRSLSYEIRQAPRRWVEGLLAKVYAA